LFEDRLKKAEAKCMSHVNFSAGKEAIEVHLSEWSDAMRELSAAAFACGTAILARLREAEAAVAILIDGVDSLVDETDGVLGLAYPGSQTSWDEVMDSMFLGKAMASARMIAAPPEEPQA